MFFKKYKEFDDASENLAMILEYCPSLNLLNNISTLHEHVRNSTTHNINYVKLSFDFQHIQYIFTNFLLFINYFVIK